MEEEIKISAYVQLYGVEKMDSFSNFSGIEITLQEIKAKFPRLERLWLSSDNAGYKYSMS